MHRPTQTSGGSSVFDIRPVQAQVVGGGTAMKNWSDAVAKRWTSLINETAPVVYPDGEPDPALRGEHVNGNTDRSRTVRRSREKSVNRTYEKHAGANGVEALSSGSSVDGLRGVGTSGFHAYPEADFAVLQDSLPPHFLLEELARQEAELLRSRNADRLLPDPSHPNAARNATDGGALALARRGSRRGEDEPTSPKLDRKRSMRKSCVSIKEPAARERRNRRDRVAENVVIACAAVDKTLETMQINSMSYLKSSNALRGEEEPTPDINTTTTAHGIPQGTSNDSRACVPVDSPALTETEAAAKRSRGRSMAATFPASSSSPEPTGRRSLLGEGGAPSPRKTVATASPPTASNTRTASSPPLLLPAHASTQGTTRPRRFVYSWAETDDKPLSAPANIPEVAAYVGAPRESVSLRGRAARLSMQARRLQSPSKGKEAESASMPALGDFSKRADRTTPQHAPADFGDPVVTVSVYPSREILRVRAAAADECSSAFDTLSEDDYAAEPEVPQIFFGDPIDTDARAIRDSCMRLSECMDFIMNEEVSSNNGGHSWWISALATLQMKSWAIRANFHARRMQSWTERLQSQMTVHNELLRRFDESALKDMRVIDVQRTDLLARIPHGNAMLQHLVAEEERLRKEIALADQNVMDVRNQRFDVLRAAARKSGVLAHENWPQKALLHSQELFSIHADADAPMQDSTNALQSLASPASEMLMQLWCLIQLASPDIESPEELTVARRVQRLLSLDQRWLQMSRESISPLHTPPTHLALADFNSV